MSTTSKAVVFTEPRQVALGQIDLSDPQPQDLVVRTLYSGVSAGTELWSLTGRYWSTKFPTIPGYQKVGVVEQVGSAVTGYQAGDTVFLRFTKAKPGTNLEWGGHTAYSVIDAEDPEMFKIPAGLDPAQGSMICLPAVGYHGAAEVMPIESGQWVAVIGLGLIGQFSAQTAKLRGARIFAIDLIDHRLKLAAEYCGAIPINPSQQDAAATIRQHCPNGLDVVIDTSAHAETINASFHWMRDRGRYCLQGYYPDTTPLDLLWPHAKELVLYNPTNVTPQGQRQCAQYLADGRMHIKSLISHVVPVDEAPAMYDMLLNRREDAMGVVLDWQGTTT